MRERLARYIATDLLNEADRVIGADEDLLASGLLDSLGVMSLIHFIEQDLRIDVPAEDVVIENFESLRAARSMNKTCKAWSGSFRAKGRRPAVEESQGSR